MSRLEVLEEIIGKIDRDLTQARRASEPEDWNMTVPKADLREILEVMKAEAFGLWLERLEERPARLTTRSVI